MFTFHRIEDAVAIIRLKGGIFKQVNVYHRNGKVYVAYGSGFVRLYSKFGEVWGTSNPNVSVVDISQDVPGLFVIGQPKYVV